MGPSRYFLSTSHISIAQSSPSGCVERSLVGNIYPIQHLASVGGFRSRKRALLLHYYRVDVQWKYNAVYKIQSQGKSFAIGAFACCSLYSFSLVNGHQLSEVTSGVAYLHNLKIVHGDLKGVSPTSLA